MGFRNQQTSLGAHLVGDVYRCAWVETTNVDPSPSKKKVEGGVPVAPVGTNISRDTSYPLLSDIAVSECLLRGPKPKAPAFRA